MNPPTDAQPPHHQQQSNGLYTHPNTHVRVDSGKPVAESWLNGQGVLVFGGATGAGAAAVRALAEAGAYVTIADSNANEGQRLMLELVGRNLRVQYTFTNLPVFRSQTEAIHYASVFSPTSTLSVIICAAIPPPVPSRGPSLSILSWLRTTTTDSTFPNPLPPPSTAPLDRAITATYHAVHLALHHFRQTPPLIPQPRMPQHHHNVSSTSAKSASSSPLSHPANHSPTSFKTAGTSTSAHAPAVPSQPAPALPLDPSTALHAHPVVSSENGETSTSPKCPTTPGSLPAPGVPVPLSAAELILPSPESPAGRALEASMQTLNLTAELLPSERKHLVVLAPAKFLSEEDDGDDADADGALGRGRRALHALPPHHMAERAAAAGLRAMVKALEELCETDAVGPGINVGCIPCEEEDVTNGHFEAKGSPNQRQEGAGDTLTADERCVRGVMRMLCGINPADRSGDGDAAGDLARAGLVDVGGDIIVTQDDALALDPDLEADLLADEPTDVEADADDEASASALDEDDDDSSSSSTTHSTSLMLAARSVAPLDRPSPSASRSALPPALGQVREEEEDEKGMSPVLPKDRDKDFAVASTPAKTAAVVGVEQERTQDGDEDEEEDEAGRAIGDDVLGVIGTAAVAAPSTQPPRGREDGDEDEDDAQQRASSGSKYDEKSKSDDRDTEREVDKPSPPPPSAVSTADQPVSKAQPARDLSQAQAHAPKDAVPTAAAATVTEPSTESNTTALPLPTPTPTPTRPADNMKPLPAVPGELPLVSSASAAAAATSASASAEKEEKVEKQEKKEAAVAADGDKEMEMEKAGEGAEGTGDGEGEGKRGSISSDISETF